MLSFFHCISVFVWTGENDSNTLRVRVFFFFFFKENGGKKIFVFKTIRIRANFRSSCIPLQIIMAMGLIRIVSSLIDFVSHVLFSLLGMKIWERYMVALMDYM